MGGKESSDWHGECREAGIDPAEVQRVARHYRAYRQYTESVKSDALPLEQWFRWYHIEKASENQNPGVAPADCSVDSHALGNSLISHPDIFLRLLEACISRSQC